MLHFKKIYWAICLLSGIGLFSACSKMDHTYSDIIKDGEIIYTGKADSVKVYPGNERIALSWLLLPDPKIKFCKIFWNNGKDSTIIPIDRTSGTDSVYIVLDDLKEGTYTFSIFTGDGEGHTSVETKASGHVYGKQYAGGLSNRLIGSARWIDGHTSIIWQQAIGNTIGVELSYTNSGGDVQTLFVPSAMDTTEIDDLKEGSQFKYRTLYLPDSAAIDTFYTDYSTFTPVFESQVDKSTFSKLILSGDALTAYGWIMPHLWDGGLDEGYGFFCRGSAFPISYTFDMGQTVKLTRFKVWQRGIISSGGYLYAGDNASKWEVWGRSDAPPTDGSWDGWTKLMTCQSIKPSGLPVGQVSEIDKAYALKGEEFIFPDTIPQVKYIRIKVLETWGHGAPQINTMEMTFWEKTE